MSDQLQPPHDVCGFCGQPNRYGDEMAALISPNHDLHAVAHKSCVLAAPALAMLAEFKAAEEKPPKPGDLPPYLRFVCTYCGAPIQPPIFSSTCPCWQSTKEPSDAPPKPGGAT